MSSKKPESDATICVGCDVSNCKFNDQRDGSCTAKQINVASRTALNKAETFCNTFLPKGSF